MERHLVISDEPYTMERIKQLSNETNTYGTFGKRREVELPTIRGSLRLYVEERSDNSKCFIIHLSKFTESNSNEMTKTKLPMEEVRMNRHHCVFQVL